MPNISSSTYSIHFVSHAFLFFLRYSNSHGSEKYPMDCYPLTFMQGKKIRYSQLTDIDCNNSVKRFCFNKEMEHAENLQTRYTSFDIFHEEKVFFFLTFELFFFFCKISRNWLRNK